MFLSQAEADLLIAAAKERTDDTSWDFPVAGCKLSIPLRSQNSREEFSLDINRGRIDLSKITYQNRARQCVTLLRLDLGGPPHRNPDDEEVPSPHLHVYKEGYGDKWAFSLRKGEFPEPHDYRRSFGDFLRLCNVVKPPIIQWAIE